MGKIYRVVNAKLSVLPKDGQFECRLSRDGKSDQTAILLSEQDILDWVNEWDLTSDDELSPVLNWGDFYPIQAYQ